MDTINPLTGKKLEEKLEINEDEIDIDAGVFPWSDVEACLDNKTSFNGEKSSDIREKHKDISCPKCGKGIDQMKVIYFSSPPETWKMSAGQSGWMAVCTDCKKQLHFELEIMS